MIYHITEKTQWIVAKASGLYEPESLRTEGFIHCCAEDSFSQIENFYYKSRAGLVALEIDELKLKAELRWEEFGDRKMPHVYGPIDMEAVVRMAELFPNSKGIFEFPFNPTLH